MYMYYIKVFHVLCLQYITLNMCYSRFQLTFIRKFASISALIEDCTFLNVRYTYFVRVLPLLTYIHLGVKNMTVDLFD